MKDTDYRFEVFGFTEKSDLWEHIIYIIDVNTEAESNIATGIEVSGEQRVHACGRVQAWKDMKSLLLEERKKALENKRINS